MDAKKCVGASPAETVRQIQAAVTGANGEKMLSVSTEWLANIAALIESLSADAELGRAAERCFEYDINYMCVWPRCGGGADGE